jgi:hypothetical protein
MSSQETVHGSLMQVIPTSGKGTLDHGGVTYNEGGRTQSRPEPTQEMELG